MALCECGCGQPTKIAIRSNAAKGHVKGRPLRFVYGHKPSPLPHAEPNPSGRCLCGCGEPVPPAAGTHYRRGQVAGRPGNYLPGHHRRKAVPRAAREDRGYAGGPCLIWRGATDRYGFGKTTHEGRVVAAHRAAWIERHGPLPPGRRLRHRCGQRLCTDPDHLELAGHG